MITSPLDHWRHPSALHVLNARLADFVAGCLASSKVEGDILLRALAAVEALAGRGGVEAELVAGAFLDSLSPDDRQMMAPLLGPYCRILLDELETGNGE